jgi:nucleotide-binding universal stress UspA family protein
MSTIVVGVDGSSGSAAALGFAIEEARIRGAELKAVSAWHVPPAVYDTGWAPVGTDIDEFRKLAEATLSTSLEDVGAADSGVAVTPILREGHPVDILVAESGRADLLVVGSRGLGGFKGLLLGSVSQQCAQHSRCPVVVVPHPDQGKAISASS